MPAELQRTDRWAEAGKLLVAEARGLVAAGAALIVLCSGGGFEPNPPTHRLAGYRIDEMRVLA